MCVPVCVPVCRAWGCRCRRQAPVPMSTTIVARQKLPLLVDPLPLPLSAVNAALAVMGLTYLFAVRVALEPLRCVDMNGQLVVASDTAIPCALEHTGE